MLKRTDAAVLPILNRLTALAKFGKEKCVCTVKFHVNQETRLFAVAVTGSKGAQLYRHYPRVTGHVLLSPPATEHGDFHVDQHVQSLGVVVPFGQSRSLVQDEVLDFGGGTCKVQIAYTCMLQCQKVMRTVARSSSHTACFSSSCSQQ